VPRRLLPLLAATAVAVVGLAGLSYGVLLATTLAPPTHTTGRVLGVTGVPVVDTATGVLDLDGPQVQVRATAASGGPVFIGVARADDVTAYLADVSRAEITRVSGDGKLTAVRAGTQAGLPDPSGADIWVASRSGTGTASLTWPDTAGAWRVVVAGDGTTGAPAEITLDWARAPRSNSAPAFITVGVLLLAGGALGLLMLRARRRDDGEDDEQDAAPPGRSVPAGPSAAAGVSAAAGAPVPALDASAGQGGDAAPDASPSAGGHTPATGLLRPVPGEPPSAGGTDSEDPKVRR
jgi:hypothetical protein